MSISGKFAVIFTRFNTVFHTIPHDPTRLWSRCFRGLERLRKVLFTRIQSGSAGKAQLRGFQPWIESLAREPDSGVFADLGAKKLVDPALKLLFVTGRCVSIDGLHYVVGAPAAQLLDVLGGHSEVVERRCENVAQVMEIHSVAVFVHVLSEALVESVVAEAHDELVVILVLLLHYQIVEIAWQGDRSGAVIGLVHLTDDVCTVEVHSLAADPKAGAVGCDVAVFEASHLGHSQRQPHRQQARQLIGCTDYKADDFIEVGQFLDLLALGRKCDALAKVKYAHILKHHRCVYEADGLFQ